MEIKEAYIRVFGAAAAALDKLSELEHTPAIEEIMEILLCAVEETEAFVTLEDC